jgi:hypothetical protein
MADMAVRFRSGPVARSDNYPTLSRLLAAHQQAALSDELSRNDLVRRFNLLAPQGTFETPSSPLSGRRSEVPSQWPELCRFSDACMTSHPRALTAGVRKAPVDEIA